MSAEPTVTSDDLRRVAEWQRRLEKLVVTPGDLERAADEMECVSRDEAELKALLDTWYNATPERYEFVKFTEFKRTLPVLRRIKARAAAESKPAPITLEQAQRIVDGYYDARHDRSNAKAMQAAVNTVLGL